MMEAVCCLAVLWLQIPSSRLIEEIGPPQPKPVVDILVDESLDPLPAVRNNSVRNNAAAQEGMPLRSIAVTEPAWFDRQGRAQRDGLPAPILELRVTDGCKANRHWRLTSDSQPPRWATVPAGPLQLRVVMPTGVTVDHIELTYDGRPLDAAIQDLGDQAFVRMPCPGVGRHVLQGRYLVEDRWSAISAALRFEVRRPRRPAIEAVGEEFGPLLPAGPTLSTGAARVRVRLSHVEPQGEVFAYLDGRLVSRVTLDEACCLTVPLREHVVAGMHSLTVRSNACGGPCALSSEPSKAVQIHYRGLQQDRLLWHAATPTIATPLHSIEPQNEAAEPRPEPAHAPAEADPVPPTPSLPTPTDPNHTALVSNPIGGAGGQLAADDRDRMEGEEAGESPDVEVIVSPRGAASGPRTQYQVLQEAFEVHLAQQAMLPASTQLQAKRTPSAPAELCSITFNSPANFPRAGFGPRGKSFDREGLLIYEGMTLEVDYQTGHYTLLFHTSAPPAPAVLRLQLKFLTAGGAWQTLTLPPVCIPPALRDCHQPLAQQLEGESHLLRLARPITDLKRSGFVRFGYGVSDGPTLRLGLGG